MPLAVSVHTDGELAKTTKSQKAVRIRPFAERQTPNAIETDGPTVKAKMVIKLVSTNITTAERLPAKPIDTSKSLLFALLCYLSGMSLLISASIVLIPSAQV
jgi:hypothetical protein